MGTTTTKAQQKNTRNSRLPPEKRIADITAAARKILSKKDYDATLMSEIADEAGIVEGTIYRHFKSKRDLFAKVAEDWFEEILTQNKAIVRVDGTLNQLRNVIWSVLSLVHSEPALTRFVIMELRPHPSYRKTRAYELSKQFTESVMSTFKAGLESGEFDDSYDLRLIRDMVFGCIERHTWSYLNRQKEFSIDNLADKIANIMYQGLLKNTPQKDNDLEGAINRLDIITSRLKKQTL